MEPNVETLPIDGVYGFSRDVKTHAVINTNNAEYLAYMRNRAILEAKEAEAKANKDKIMQLSSDIDELKQLVAQLLNKDSNAASSTNK